MVTFLTMIGAGIAAAEVAAVTVLESHHTLRLALYDGRHDHAARLELRQRHRLQPNQEDDFFVRNLLGSITEREATILRLRYGLSEHGAEPLTLKEIGKIVGLTRERVRQIERETLAKLSRVMGES